MPVSGTVPSYDIGTSADTTPVTAAVTGLVFPASGVAASLTSSETIQAALARFVTALSISGTAVANGVRITSGHASGLAQIQREIAFRVADIERPGEANAARLTRANALLTASGEFQWA